VGVRRPQTPVPTTAIMSEETYTYQKELLKTSCRECGGRFSLHPSMTSHPPCEHCHHNPPITQEQFRGLWTLKSLSTDASPVWDYYQDILGPPKET